MSGAARSLHRALLLALLGAALGGCLGSLLQSKARPQTVYQLAPPAADGASGAAPGAPAGPASGGAAAGVELAVLTPRVRSGLDDDQVRVAYPDHHLDFLAGARWSGSLDEMLQDLIIEAFRARAPQVGVETDHSAFGTAYWLEVDVDDFQAEYSAAGGPPVAHVHLEARLGATSDRRILEHLELDARQAAAQNRVGAIIEAYNRATDEVLRELVARTLPTLGAPSAASAAPKSDASH